MVRNIVFDFGKVLVDFDFKSFVSTIIEDGEEQSEFLSVVCNDEFVALCDKGDTSFPELVRGLQEEYPQWVGYLQEFHDRQLDAITSEIPGMRSLIERLRREGYGVYGLSNWSEVVYDVIEKFDILKMLDGRLISSEEKLIKPDPAIYRRFCEKFSLKPEECLFTDDKAINVEGAKKAGMQAVLFTGAEALEEYIHSLR